MKLFGNALSAVLTALAFASLLGVSILPNVLGYKTYVVLSGSMEPAIHTGSMLVARAVAPETLKVGDVIVYNRSDVSQSVTHRIVKIDSSGVKPIFVTKGDANGAPDSWTVQYNGNTGGKVILALPYLGYVYHAIGSPQGRLVFLVVPVVVLTVMWLAEIWRPRQDLSRRDLEVAAAIAPGQSAEPNPLPAAETLAQRDRAPDAATSPPLRQ